MPLPRSINCSSCQHAYPEGWKRCPYCGFDPEKQKRDRQIERALIRKFPSYASAVGVKDPPKKKNQSRGGRPSGPTARQEEQLRAQGTPAEGGEKRSRRRRGRRRRGASTSPVVSADAPKTQTPAGPRNGNDARPRREPVTNTPPPQQGGESSTGTESQARRARRRRPRRRRKPQGGGGEPKSDS
jgi:hypothetical protein